MSTPMLKLGKPKLKLDTLVLKKYTCICREDRLSARAIKGATMIPITGVSRPNRSISAQKDPSQPDRPFPTKSSFRGQATPKARISMRLVDRGGAGLESGKLEIESKPPLFETGSIRLQSDSNPSLVSMSETESTFYPPRQKAIIKLVPLPGTQVPFVSTTNDYDFTEYNSSNVNADFNFGVSKSQELEPMANNDRALKELATPYMYLQLELAQSYELKSNLIHLLPKFHGLAGEDSHKHLKEFLVGILEDYIKMKAFPFSLDGAAKDWLYLQPILFNTWADMKRIILKKLFPASRTMTIKKEICGIRHHSGETLHEY
ncbi:hypothetical protein CR513_14823, partial [Mucuna pruriens]